MRKIYRKFIKPFLSLKTIRILTDLKFNFYYKKSYSQFGEDLIIYNFFEKIKEHEKNYLDIGAYHPKMISNTHLLHRNNWSGYVVDTSDFKLKLFEKMRGRKIKTINRAVVQNHEKKEKLSFFFFELPFSEIDTLSQEFAEQKKRERNVNYSRKEINTIKINDLLKMEDFDFVNIDIEGMDEKIINSIDFKSIHKPKLICFEDHNSYLKDQNSYVHLINNGYRHLFTSGPSVGFYLLLN
jgi:hypothetical protein